MLDLDEFHEWLPYVVFVSGVLLSAAVIAWALMTKSDATSAVAWCLVIIFLPFVGAIFFFFFGYQHVTRPLTRKRRHRSRYSVLYPRRGGQERPEPERWHFGDGQPQPPRDPWPVRMARLADRFGAFAVTRGNEVDFYHDGESAYGAMLEAIRGARHHVHLQTFIFQPDATGDRFLEELTAKARQGVQVRLLYDAIGSHRLWRRRLRCLLGAGGKCSVFLPLNPFRRRMQVNLRNHRKILVVDGKIGFTGGLNVGDEYLGRVERFGYWRDTHLRVRGPAASDLQRVFAEDWNFAADEPLALPDSEYFPPEEGTGTYPVQVIDSGPDRELKAIREIYFAAILRARRRVWIASPYFVPDAGLRDALRLAGYQGLDVRLLCQYRPDKWLPQYAAQYYWAEMVQAGVKVYQYTRGMMHSKVMLVDDEWASVGSANLDNRSLHLNFEVNCLIYSAAAVTELEAAFLRDLGDSIRLDRAVYQRRPFATRLLENACRLLSPVL